MPFMVCHLPDIAAGPNAGVAARYTGCGGWDVLSSVSVDCTVPPRRQDRTDGACFAGTLQQIELFVTIPSALRGISRFIDPV
jgi:hypothetical protein